MNTTNSSIENIYNTEIRISKMKMMHWDKILRMLKNETNELKVLKYLIVLDKITRM